MHPRRDLALDEPRRSILLGIATLGATALSACTPKEEAKPDAVSTLVNHDKVVNAMDELVSAVDELNQAIGAFDDDNWREVVPMVRDAASGVDSALSTLKDLMAGNTPDQ